MGREPRIQFEGAVCHVFPRGNRRERIAHSDRDYRILEKYFLDAARRFNVVPRAWQPMPNHFHALIETPDGNLSAFMQAWLGRYARYYNRVYKKVGHLFQGRYGSRLVQKETHLLELIRYIHLQRYRAKNPASVDVYCERYSSHRFYMGETCPADVREWIEPMLNLFGETLETARKNYAKFLADGLQSGNWQDFYRPRAGILGDDQFIARVANQKSHKDKEPVLRRKPEADEILHAAADFFQVSVEKIRSRSQRRDISAIRHVVARVGQEMGLSVTQLAQALRRGQSTVSAMIGAAETRVEGGLEGFREKMNL